MIVLEVATSVTDEVLLNAVVGLAAVLLFTGLWKVFEFISHKVFDEKSSIFSLRTVVVFWWVGSPWEAIQEGIALAMSVTSCIIFIILSTQVAEVSDKASATNLRGEFVEWDPTEYDDLFKLDGENSAMLIVEEVICFYYLFEYFLLYFLAARKFHYVFSLHALIDQVTVLPAIVALFTGTYFYGFMFLRFVRMLKSLYYFRNIGWNFLSGVMAQGVLLVITIISVFFCAAGFIFVTENDTASQEGLVADFLDAIYFIVVSFTTVGYGDISPKSQLGKVVVMAMIIVGIAVVPASLDRLLTLARENSDKAHKWYRGDGHIVVYSHVAQVLEFFREFYHPDHENTNIKSNLMVTFTEPLPREVSDTLKEPVYHFRIHDMIGSALNDIDLTRASMSTARHVFVLADKYAEDADAEDARVIMETFALRKFHPDLPMSVQILNEKHRESVRGARVQHVLCINEMRMGMLAQACVCPGFSTLLGNLVRSVSEEELAKQTHYMEEHARPITQLPKMYQQGLGNELYQVKDMQAFAGLSFTEAALIMYVHFKVLLIGVTPKPNARESEEALIGGALRGAFSTASTGAASLMDTDSDSLTLNPGSKYVIPKSSKVFGIVLAQDETQIHAVESFDQALMETDDTLRRFLKKLKKDLKGDVKARESFMAEACPFISRGDKADALGKSSESTTPLTSQEKKRAIGHRLQHLGRGPLKSTTELLRTLDRETEEDCKDHAAPTIYDSTGKKVEVDDHTLPMIEAWTGGRHIVVVGESVTDIVCFVEKIRAYDVKHVKPIVIMTPNGLPKMEEQELGRQQRVFQMLGRPTDMHDLERAGIYKADNAILLGGMRPTNSSDDAESVVAYRLCKRGTTFPIIDLAFAENSAYLGPLASTNVDYLENPYYAAGQMFASSCLDTLLCQTFFEPYQLRTVRHLLDGNVFSLHVEDHFQHLIGKHCAKLFAELLGFDLVLLGLYRRNENTPLRFVVTNPDPQEDETKIHEKDIVYVLNSSKRAKQSFLATVTAHEQKLELKELRRQEKEARTARAKAKAEKAEKAALLVGGGGKDEKKGTICKDDDDAISPRPKRTKSPKVSPRSAADSSGSESAVPMTAVKTDKKSKRDRSKSPKKAKKSD